MQPTKRPGLMLALIFGWLLFNAPYVVAQTDVQEAREAGRQTELADPATLGFDVTVLGEIDQVMTEGIEAGEIIGCNAMILKDDKICYYQQWGQQDKRKDVPVSRDAIWRIYSMTKPITSIAAMQLVEQGKLDLDGAVSEHIPEFANMKVLVEKDGKFTEEDAKREITVRDLLRHSSGLSYGLFGSSEVDKRYVKAGILLTTPDLKSMAERLGKIPLKHQPGAQFEYSISTDMLGYLVEVVSEQRFDEYLNEHIFQPLSMQDTYFVLPEDKQSRFAEMYRPSRDGSLKPAPRRSSLSYLKQDNRFFSGGGGLCCSIDDYMQFCRMLLNKGQLDGKQIVSEESLKEMWTNQLGDLETSSSRFKFGLGFSISPEGDYSWGGIAGTRFWVNPEKNLAMIYMIQISPYRARFGNRMRQIVYRALEE